MLLTMHVLTGAVVGLSSGNLLLTAPIAFATHGILDALPHWSFPIPKQKTPASFIHSFAPDLLIAIVLYALLTGIFADTWFNMSWGIGWAILPDWLTLYRDTQPWKRLLRPFYAFHNTIQWEIAKGPGLAVQAILALLLIFLLLERVT